MTETVFIANAFGRRNITPTVGLGVPMFVIHGTYRHPLTGVDTSLPSHHFAVVRMESGEAVAIGKKSDENGVCVVNQVGNPGPGPFLLTFVPADLTVRNYMIDENEAWIDLDTGEWASSQPNRNTLERRNLYRIPAWTTQLKAARGGGFKDWVQDAAESSREGGLLDYTDLRRGHGSHSKAWDIPIDYKWPIVSVRYRYFDWGRDKENTLPPGLFVDAVPRLVGTDVPRVGTGVAVKNGDGTARMMIEAATPSFPAVEFQFKSPKMGHLRVDLMAPEPAPGTKDTRLVIDTPIPTERHKANTLPDEWHSLGHQCVVTTPWMCFEKRAPWLEVARNLEGDLDVTVEFHLDDVYVADSLATTGTSYTGTPTLFDHYLAVMHPQLMRPHLSDCHMVDSTIAASKAYTIGETLPTGRKRLHMSTRLIHFDGMLFDLRDERMIGKLGRTSRVGARVALQNNHRMAKYDGFTGNPHIEGQGFYQLHYIDTAGVPDPASGLRLGHILLFVPVSIDASGFAESYVDMVYQMLTWAAERWSQGSPGVSAPTATLSKDYRILSKNAALRDRVFRLRAYFGEVEKRTSDSSKVEITLATAGRSGLEGRWRRKLSWAVPLKPYIWYLQDSLLSDMGALSKDFIARGKDSDGVELFSNRLAHEFGHVLGLPDDYAEPILAAQVGAKTPACARIWGCDEPRVPAYPNAPGVDYQQGMPTDYRPFQADIYSLMGDLVALPRLRHYWHHVAALNAHEAFAGLRGAPFILRHETLGGKGVEYIPPLEDVVRDAHHPYAAVFDDEPVPHGFGRCALFPTGEDEATAESMFGTSTLPEKARVDGLLIVRAKVRFRFSGAITPSEQWSTIWDNLMKVLYDENGRTKQRFVIAGGRRLRRIAILLQPHCSVGMDPKVFDDIRLLVSKTPAPPPNPFSLGRVGSTVELDVSQFDANCLWRAILGVPTNVDTAGGRIPNRTALTVGDFANLLALVDAKLTALREPGHRVEPM